MTAHFDRNISFVTFLTQNPLKIFISCLKNSDYLYVLVIDHKSCFLLFSNFPRNNHLFLPKFRDKFSFHSSKSLMTANRFIFQLFHLSTPPPLIHHCKNSLSSLHIFVHHCTYCASLHVKRSPVYLIIFVLFYICSSQNTVCLQAH